MADKKTGFLDRYVDHVAKLIVIIGLFLVLPQQKIAKKGLPALWKAVKKLGELGYALAEDGYRMAAEWWIEYWPAFRRFVRRWFLFSLALLCAGILAKQQMGYPFVGQMLAASGVLMLTLLCIGLYALGDRLSFVFTSVLESDRIKAILKLKSPDGSKIEIKASEKREEMKSLHQKYKSSFALLVLMNAAFLPFIFFVSWKSLGLIVIMAAIAMPAILAVIHQNAEVGPIIEKVKWVSIIAFLAFVTVFIVSELFPNSFGSASFSRLDEWFSARNNAEWAVGLILLIPAAMLLKGAFTKDKEKKGTWFQAAKIVGILSVILVVFLLYKTDSGVSWKGLTGHDGDQTLEDIEKKFDSIGGKKKENRPSIESGASLRGMPQSTPLPLPSASSSSVATKPYEAPRPVIQTKPMPPPPAPQRVDSLGQGLQKLDEL